MSITDRKNVPATIARTYCAKADCDGDGFYSARCKFEGHPTKGVTYVPAELLDEAMTLLTAARGRGDGSSAWRNRIMELEVRYEKATA